MMDGLSTAQVTELQLKFGKNEIVSEKKLSTITLFVQQFRNPLVFLLLAACVISFVLGEFVDGFMILAIVILNGIFGFVQEFKAEKAIAALKKMAISKTRVIRNGVELHVDSTELVPGDLLVLEQGDRIPADATIVSGKNIEVNESILTGESIPVEKNHLNPEESSILLGTVLTRGHLIARVETIGMDTRFGLIAASLTSIENEETPLEKRVNSLGKLLGLLGVTSSLLLFLIGILRQHPFTEMLFTSISLAVAAVPEGLPAVITITLALGTQRMVKRRAILRKLSAIEALGSVSIIATDKTGTLTKNEMHVTTYWTLEGRKIKTSQSPASPLVAKLHQIGVLCNNASIHFHEGRTTMFGDPTESALLLFGHQSTVTKESALGEGEIVEEFEFDSSIKAMSVVFKPDGGDEIELLTKGAPEVVLKMSTQVLTDEGPKRLRQEVINQIEEEYLAMASQGLRVIAFAYRPCHQVSQERHHEEKDLIFVGFVGIEDPPREEVKEAIKKAQTAGIRTIMITGDNPLTAHSVGKAIGLVKEDSSAVVTGQEIDSMSDEELSSILETTSIYARTSPENKLRIVTLLQKQGHVVSVTGDGVNDALALKQADVGVAMGITGSDVSKGAADMIVTDDNYATIVSAIEEGRTIYDNMKSSIKFLLGCNIGEVLSILIATLIGWPMILTPLQILFINLVTDGIPALGLSAVPAHRSIMQRKPNTGNNLFTKFDYRWLIETASISTAVILVAFALGQSSGSLDLARTLAFLASIAVQQYIYLDLQARNFSILSSFRHRIYLPMIGIIPLLIQIWLIYNGAFERIFAIVPIPTHLLLTIVSLAGIAIVSSEIRKKLFSKYFYPHS